VMFIVSLSASNILLVEADSLSYLIIPLFIVLFLH
jgi:hypothetical protein